MAARSSEVSGATATVVIIVLVIAIIAGGIWFVNRPPRDEIAAAVTSARGGAPAPIGPGAPMGGVPPKPGASDYQRATPMPAAPPARQ
jgi:hypothetical protein